MYVYIKSFAKHFFFFVMLQWLYNVTGATIWLIGRHYERMSLAPWATEVARTQSGC
jgi:hypothetical protein